MPVPTRNQVLSFSAIKTARRRLGRFTSAPLHCERVASECCVSARASASGAAAEALAQARERQ
jgi:hypothetical protein